MGNEKNTSNSMSSPPPQDRLNKENIYRSIFNYRPSTPDIKKSLNLDEELRDMCNDYDYDTDTRKGEDSGGLGESEGDGSNNNNNNNTGENKSTYAGHREKDIDVIASAFKKAWVSCLDSQDMWAGTNNTDLSLTANSNSNATITAMNTTTVTNTITTTTTNDNNESSLSSSGSSSGTSSGNGHDDVDSTLEIDTLRKLKPHRSAFNSVSYDVHTTQSRLRRRSSIINSQLLQGRSSSNGNTIGNDEYRVGHEQQELQNVLQKYEWNNDVTQGREKQQSGSGFVSTAVKQGFHVSKNTGGNNTFSSSSSNSNGNSSSSGNNYRGASPEVCGSMYQRRGSKQGSFSMSVYDDIPAQYYEELLIRQSMNPRSSFSATSFNEPSVPPLTSSTGAVPHSRSPSSSLSSSSSSLSSFSARGKSLNKSTSKSSTNSIFSNEQQSKAHIPRKSTSFNSRESLESELQNENTCVGSNLGNVPLIWCTTYETEHVPNIIKFAKHLEERLNSVLLVLCHDVEITVEDMKSYTVDGSLLNIQFQKVDNVPIKLEYLDSVSVDNNVELPYLLPFQLYQNYTNQSIVYISPQLELKDQWFEDQVRYLELQTENGDTCIGGLIDNENCVLEILSVGGGKESTGSMPVYVLRPNEDIFVCLLEYLTCYNEHKYKNFLATTGSASPEANKGFEILNGLFANKIKNRDTY